MNTAIIVAAGSGTRFNSDTPKQFLEIHGKPVIVHTLERFTACPAVDSIVLVLAEDRIDRFTASHDLTGLGKVAAIVAGGATRSRSVANGLASVDPSTGIVIVHDGARPLVSADEIDRTIEKAEEVGAACVVAPVTDTIKEVNADRIVRTVDRRDLRRALTPQAFRFEIIKRAFDEIELGESVTDECYLVEKLGLPVAVVGGSSRNIKITHTEDLVLAEYLMGSVS